MAMSRATTPSMHPLTIGVGAVLLGCALWYAPAHMGARARGIAWDALRPGLLFAQTQRKSVLDWRSARAAESLQELQAELDRVRSERDQALDRTQRLAAQLAQQLAAPPPLVDATSDPEGPARLFTPALVEAAVLGETLAEAWRSGRILDRGWKSGLRESALVLSSRRPLLDLGQTQQLAPEDTLLVGQNVVGKIELVGQWTSTFLPVTDPEYRGRAQLLRQTAAGVAWGAAGLIVGTGEACQLSGIPATEAVRPGDLVYTAERDGILSAPLCYGEVTHAELDAQGREWVVTLRPLAQPAPLTRVHVMRAALNPARFWTH
jgi:cell shape-determining protein MreC